MKDIYISGFADEISSSFDEQLKTVRELGMQYISLRSADKKGIADFTVEEVKTDLLPRLQALVLAFPAWAVPLARSRSMMKRALKSSVLSWKRCARSLRS